MDDDCVMVEVSIEMEVERYTQAMKVLDGEDLTVEDALYFLLLECARSGRWPLPPEESYFSRRSPTSAGRHWMPSRRPNAS